MKDKEVRKMLHKHQQKTNERYQDNDTRLEQLEKHDKKVRNRDAIIGFTLIIMSIGWNKIASICQGLPFVSFSYNEGWGLAQGGMLAVGLLFIVFAMYQKGKK